MNLAHLHLLLNHFPTIGMILGLSLAVLAWMIRSNEFKQISLGLLLIISLISIPTYATGNAAEEMVANRPGISMADIDAHEGNALLALMAMQLLGLIAWAGLWQYQRDKVFARWLMPVILILGAVTFGLMAQTANIGGEISHSEIRANPESLDSPYTSPIDVAGLAKTITDSTWIWAGAETLHFMGMALLFGVVLLVDLRILGAMKNVSFAALHRLLPWGVVGFAVNVLTGMMFFIAASGQYTTNKVFHWKLALVLLAGVNAMYFTLFDETWTLQAGDSAPARAKFMAASALVLWVGVIYAGRMLPFIGNAF